MSNRPGRNVEPFSNAASYPRWRRQRRKTLDDGYDLLNAAMGRQIDDVGGSLHSLRGLDGEGCAGNVLFLFAYMLFIRYPVGASFLLRMIQYR